MSDKSDVRNIINVNNQFGCNRTAVVFNQESANNTFPILPDKVRVEPGNNEPTGGMWIPWCDSQQELEAGHYIELTFKEKHKQDMVKYMFQSKELIYIIETDKLFENRKAIDGDSSLGKGEYELQIRMDNESEIYLSVDKY